MKNGYIIILLCFYLISSIEAQTINLTKKDTTEFIDSVLNTLTIEEKVGQLNLISIEGEPTEEHKRLIKEGKVGAILKSNGVKQNKLLQEIAINDSRRGIPILFQEDVIHGYRTIGPIPLAEAATWDEKAVAKASAIAAKEASSAGIHLTYAPMVDVTRDPRWGRILETSGEDPYLTSLLTKARIKGFENYNKNNSTLLSCAKHFVGYGSILAGRDYNINDFSERELREIHLPPFKAAIESGVSSLMCAYTAYDGIPLTINKYLIKDILRKELSYNGLIMTDWRTIPNLVEIGVVPNDTLATKKAIENSIDMDMASFSYMNILPYLIKHGIVSEDILNESVRRVLLLKHKVGLFNNPYGYFDENREKHELLSKKNYSDIKDVTLKSIVLLKNNNDILPIKPDKKQKVAIVGPLAKSKKDLLGWWWCQGKENETTSIYEGITKAKSNIKFSYNIGCPLDSFKLVGKEYISKAVESVQDCDYIICVLGEEYWMSGEGGGTASLHLPGYQELLVKELSKTGKPIISIIVAGRPYILTEIEKYSQALIMAWMPGTTGGDAVADIIYGKFNPCGKLPVTFPYHFCFSPNRLGLIYIFIKGVNAFMIKIAKDIPSG